MPKLRVHNLTVSLDGYAAGPNQGLDNPLGEGGTRLHEWLFATRAFRQTHGTEGGEGGLDDHSSPRAMRASVPPSWGATCSARSGGPGAVTRGRAGGARIRRSTTRCSCSPITPALHAGWDDVPFCGRRSGG